MGGSDIQPLKLIESVSVNFERATTDQLPEGQLEKLKTVFVNCFDAIKKAHANGKEAFRHQQEVQRFLTSKIVKISDSIPVDYATTNPKVNFTELSGNMFYVGNHKNWLDFASEYVGKWTKKEQWNNASDYIFEGKHINVGKDLKDSGVETLESDHFYGKFAGGKRTSGVYTWSNGSFYMGDFKDGNVHGFGCLKQVLPTPDEFIFGNFNNNMLPESYISKRSDKIYWVSSGTPTELSNDQASVISHYLNKVTEDFKQLGLWTKGLHKLEDNTGLNRTGLYGIAALALAGVGFWAYKKYKKSSTQKNKALTRGEKAAITRKKNKAAKEAAASVSVSGSNSASAMEDNAGSGSASAMGSNVAAGTRKNKSASKSARRSEAAKKGALTRAANKAAKAANVKVEGSNVKVEGSDAVWRSPAENKEDESKAVESKAVESKVSIGLRRSERLREKK